MTINRISEEYDVYHGNDKLNQVEEYTYLGIKFDSTNIQEMEIDSQINKYIYNVRLFYPSLMDKNINRDSKLIVYSTIVK